MTDWSKDTELDFWQKYKKEGDKDAKKKLIKSLTPLIKSQVNKFSNSGLPIPALELEGKRLAAIAIESYDPDKAALNTHVMNNLRKLSRFSTTYQNIGHIPEPRVLLLGKYNTIFANLEDEKGREPTIEELSDAMHIPPAEVNRLQKEIRNDLQMELPSDEDESGFHMYVAPDMEDPLKRQAVEFVYFDMDNTNKKIMEYVIPGIGPSQKLINTEIKKKLGITENELRRRREEISRAITELL